MFMSWKNNNFSFVFFNQCQKYISYMRYVDAFCFWWINSITIFCPHKLVHLPKKVDDVPEQEEIFEATTKFVWSKILIKNRMKWIGHLISNERTQPYISLILNAIIGWGICRCVEWSRITIVVVVVINMVYNKISKRGMGLGFF